MGRYCQVCGQENIETHETFWQLTTHLIYDIVHFDGKFFSTLKSLLFKPGFLTHEYIRGKRASYLHPVRMYVFTSTIFFIIFFAFIVPTEAIHNSNEFFKEDKPADSVTIKKGNTASGKAAAQSLKDRDSLLKKLSAAGININDSSGPVKILIDSAPKRKGPSVNFSGQELPKTIGEYDSLQKMLPGAKKDGWFTRKVKERSILITGKYGGDMNSFMKVLFENFLHSLPKMMFISLPLAALLLQLLYIRRRQFLYVQHGVFLIHVYIATYIMFLLQYGLKALNDLLHWSVIGYVSGFAVFVIFFYLYKAMRNFYGQRRGKTILKFLMFNFLYLIILTLLAAVFFTTSIFEI